GAHEPGVAARGGAVGWPVRRIPHACRGYKADGRVAPGHQPHRPAHRHRVGRVDPGVRLAVPAAHRRQPGPHDACAARGGGGHRRLQRVPHPHLAGGQGHAAHLRPWGEARVTLLDCDSMQVRAPASGEWFFCRVGRPEFTPPELVRADWATTVRHPSSDLFALAIHLYQLLLEGEHPFRGVWRGDGDKPPVSVLAEHGIWAHQNGGPLAPRPAASSAGLLPPAIVAMFRRAFEDGALDPGARPTAAQWHGALDGLASELRQCTADRMHFYPRSHDACPWCRYIPPPA